MTPKNTISTKNCAKRVAYSFCLSYNRYAYAQAKGCEMEGCRHTDSRCLCEGFFHGASL